jgi:hypothetical protein
MHLDENILETQNQYRDRKLNVSVRKIIYEHNPVSSRKCPTKIGPLLPTRDEPIHVHSCQWCLHNEAMTFVTVFDFSRGRQLPTRRSNACDRCRRN